MKKKRKGVKTAAPKCPYCGSHTIFRSAVGIYHNNPEGEMLYVCKNYPVCDAYVRVHKGTTIPMGVPANWRLRKLRNEAHRYFDQLYKSGYMSRQDAYHWLADILCVPYSQAHIGYLGEYYCQKVIEESKKVLARNPVRMPEGEGSTMTLTEYQQRVVEENMGLVGRVIKDKVHGLGREGAFTYEDLFQIGCIGLCKAAATDRGGCFSTYAYRLIWNEICDALVRTTRINQNETVLEADEIMRGVREHLPDPLEACELKQILESAGSSADGVTAKGVQCLVLSAQGYTSTELSRMFHANPPAVRMWMTKARRYLRGCPELASYAGR